MIGYLVLSPQGRIMGDPVESYAYLAAEAFMSASRETDARKRAKHREEGRRLVDRLYALRGPSFGG